MKSSPSGLGSEKVVEAIVAATPVEVVNLLNRLPNVWFNPTPEAIRGLCRLLKATQGGTQAAVIKTVFSKSQDLLKSASVSELLFLAAQVGQRGNLQGVQEIYRCWKEVVRTPELASALSSTLASCALLHHNQEAWAEAIAQDPSQSSRPDRLRLAARRAQNPAQIEWALGHAEQCPWTECAQVAWEMLGRGWAKSPLAYPIELPELAVEASCRLLSNLPWEDAAVSPAIERMFNHSRSPLRTLMDMDYQAHPVERLRALAACQTLAEQLESQGVSLQWGSERLANARQRQQERLVKP